jgi:indole-3-glycerol phosphate synthase
MTILDEIVIAKRGEIAAAQLRCPREQMELRVESAPPARSFRDALTSGGRIHLIAEVKRASPTAGVIRNDYDPVAISYAYQQHGASCVSVVTDTRFFRGHLADLAQVREVVTIPLLRKDFIISDYQVLEARSTGADAILLIAEVLDDATLKHLQDQARRLGMSVLVEFHDERNLPRILASGADFVGINNRDLRTFCTDIEHTLRLRDRFPPEILLVSESGIHTRRDVERLQAAGISAILVGEALMRARDIRIAIERLLGRAAGCHTS